jgi:hypothetical protein
MRSTRFLHLLLITALTSAYPARSAEEKAADPGAKVFEDSCLNCHKGKESLDQVRLTRDKWKEAVDRMIDSSFLDPVPSRDKLKLLLDYLAKTKGPAETTGVSKS